jgi:hypothetical protein
MLMGVLLVTAMLSTPAITHAKEKRCGWIANPTPANWTLRDRSREWLIGAQGGYQAPGLDLVPDLTTSDWVITNGSSYGYGCACLSVSTDLRKGRVTRIFSIQQQPLKVCRADRRLPAPGR